MGEFARYHFVIVFISLNHFLYVFPAPTPNNFTGPNRNFRCYCEGGDVCGNDGSCPGRCSRPNFGHLCQYVDISVEARKGSQDLSFLTDYDDTTCNEDDVREISYSFYKPYAFGFVFIVYKKLPFTFSNKKYDIRLSFVTDEDDEVNCEGQQIRELGETKAELYCSVRRIFTHFQLSGQGVKYICTMHISGGRNLALFRQVTGDPFTQYFKLATDNDRAVCFSTQAYRPNCKITLYRNIYLQRIRLFTIPTKKCMLWNFTVRYLDLFDNEAWRIDKLFNMHIDDVIDIVVNPKALINKVQIISLAETLSFSEIETYGDCLDGFEGLDCSWENQRCSNKTSGKDGTCYVATNDPNNVLRKPCQGCLDKCNDIGMCPGNCTPGYKGERCNDACKNCREDDPTCDKMTGKCNNCYHGYFGATCDSSCDHCSNTGTCSRETGHCHWGCVPGYMGDLCDEECTNCAGDGSCLRRTGYCVHGCKDGYRGGVCILMCHNCAGRGTCERIEGRCDDGCVYGYQGLDCSIQCGHCTTGTTCDRFDGYCAAGCEHGYKGVRCDTSCLNCVNESCSQEDGKCDSGCKDGFSGDDCETPCGHCNEKNPACDKRNRRCLGGCKPGYFRPECTDVCDTCGGDNTCERATGACKDGCKPGFSGRLCKDHIEDEYDRFNEQVFYTIFTIVVSCFVFYIVCYPRLSRKNKHKKRTHAPPQESLRASTIGPASRDPSEAGLEEPTEDTVDPADAKIAVV